MLDAPHRLSFAAAAVMLCAASLWWAMVNVATGLGVAIRWGLPPSVAHSVLMTFGFMPLFFAGFMFTAGPRWLSCPAVSATTLVAPITAQLLGWLLFALALHVGDIKLARTLSAIGLVAVALGWGGVAARFLCLLRRSRASDKVHATWVAAASLFGVVALCLTALGLFSGNIVLVRAAVHSSLWGFIGLTFATVSHRMIPFFSAAAMPALDAWRPLWLLWCFAALFAFQGAAAIADVQGWVGASGWRQSRGGVELIGGAGVLALATRWGLVQSLRIRLLAMLHGGFTWLGAALVLEGISQFACPAHGVSTFLELAATHAYTMGFLGSTMLAMVTRLSSGHSGRTVAADDFVWRLYGVLQLAVFARIAGALSAAFSAPISALLIAAAALGWAGACAAWAVRCTLWYGLPRIDGRPG